MVSHRALFTPSSLRGVHSAGDLAPLVSAGSQPRARRDIPLYNSTWSCALQVSLQGPHTWHPERMLRWTR